MDNRGNRISSFHTKGETHIKRHAYDDVQFDYLPEDKKSIVTKLLYFFTFQSAKVSKHSYDDLQEHYFMELIELIWEFSGKKLQKNNGLWVDLKILFYSKGYKNSLNFKNFLELLPTLAVFAEPEVHREEALRSLMHNIIKLYHSEVLPAIDKKLINVDLSIEENTRGFLSKISNDLTKLYKLYFPHEISAKCKKDEFKQLSFDCLLSFLKDFEVFPKVISSRDVFYIFTESLSRNPSDLLYETEDSRSIFSDQGRVFRLTKFVETLIIISKTVFPKLKQVENEEEWEDRQKDLLRTLLEYMETTKLTVKKKTKFMNERFCFIVLDEHPEQELVKTIQIEGIRRKEAHSNMNFFNILEKLKF